MNETARDLMGATALLGTGPSELDMRTLPCRLGDPDLWFAESPIELERARRLCRSCPVRAGCLAGARRRREPWGVWGAEIFDRGTVVPFKRPRGRPPNTPRSVPDEPAAG